MRMLKRIPAVALACLVLACACQAQTSQTTTEGQILIGNSSGALVPGSPFACNVDGNVFKIIGDCVTFLSTGSGGAQFGGVITSNRPEYITSANGLPWNPGVFTGVLRLGQGGNSTSCPATLPYNCWLTDVPIVIGSGMTIVGSGNVPNGNSFASGTAIVPSSSFPSPLGQPTGATLSCGTTGSGVTYYVQVADVNNLDTNSGASALKVPGFSAPTTETSITCAGGSTLIVNAPTGTTGTTPLPASDYRVYVATTPGSETLQVPTSCGTPGFGSVDSNFACKLGTGGQATISASLTTTGDNPNLVDLSNPLVVDIGPVNGSGTSAQNEGFWAVLQNLTLAQTGSLAANTPNVAFWNPSDQENSGISFVSATGPFGSTTDASLGGGTWIYIGNHAPNSFVSNFQSDTNPTAGTFYGMILDGRPGFGSALGTARVVSNSTFTPGRVLMSAATVPAGIYVTGSKAYTNFNEVHVETPTAVGAGTDSNFEISNGASGSVRGPQQFGNLIVHLKSTGASVSVTNITSGPSGSQVIKDDVNGVNTLGSSVVSYATSVHAGSVYALNVQGNSASGSPPTLPCSAVKTALSTPPPA